MENFITVLLSLEGIKFSESESILGEMNTHIVTTMERNYEPIYIGQQVPLNTTKKIQDGKHIFFKINLRNLDICGMVSKSYRNFEKVR
jgi:hypothetical protein